MLAPKPFYLSYNAEWQCTGFLSYLQHAYKWTGAGLPLPIHRTCPVLWHRQSRGFGSLISESNVLSSFSCHLPAICCTPPLPRVGGCSTPGSLEAQQWQALGRWVTSSSFCLSNSYTLVQSARSLLFPIHRAGTGASLQCPAQPHSRAWWGIHGCTCSTVSFLHLQSQDCLPISLLQDCPCVCWGCWYQAERAPVSPCSGLRPAGTLKAAAGQSGWAVVRRDLFQLVRANNICQYLVYSCTCCQMYKRMWMNLRVKDCAHTAEMKYILQKVLIPGIQLRLLCHTMKRFYAPRLLHPNYYIYFGASWNYYFLDEGVIGWLEVYMSSKALWALERRLYQRNTTTIRQEPTSI